MAYFAAAVLDRPNRAHLLGARIRGARDRCEIISHMKGLTSSLALANLALREGRREDAVFLYSSAREATPGLRTHIDFNLDYMGRELQGEEKSQIFVASAESPIPKERIPTRPVLVIVSCKKCPGSW